METPLTTLLKNEAFSWTLEATQSFEQLKEAMWKAPTLTTPVLTFTIQSIKVLDNKSCSKKKSITYELNIQLTSTLSSTIPLKIQVEYPQERIDKKEHKR